MKIFNVTGSMEAIASAYSVSVENFTYKYNTSGTSKTYNGTILLIAMYKANSGYQDNSTIYAKVVPGVDAVYTYNAQIAAALSSSDNYKSFSWEYSANHTYTISDDFRTLTVKCNLESSTSTLNSAVKVYYLNY